MGGVDIAYQYRSYFDTYLMTFKTWFPIFFWALDTALVNSYIIYRDLDTYESIKNKEFCLLVAWDLILEGAHEVEALGPKKQKLSMIVETGKQFFKELKYVAKSTALPRNPSVEELLPIANKGHEKECLICR